MATDVCGVGKCLQRKVVMTQREDVLGVERGVCKKHREMARQLKGWTVTWEEDKWEKEK